MQVAELTPGDFNESLLPIFLTVINDEVRRKFAPAHFFPTWREWMHQEIARTWYLPGVVLGALFTNCVFTDDLQALVVFWFSLPEIRGTGAPEKVFAAFEDYSKVTGVKAIYSAAYNGLNHQKRSEGYEKHGFEFLESTFKKRLTN